MFGISQKKIIHAACCYALMVLAGTPVSYAADAPLDLEETKSLLQGVRRNDLDAHFSYAKQAMKERNAREAEWALRKMLEKDPSLDRVKLELAVSLIPQGKLVEAKQLFGEVKAKNPPAAVVKNIDTMLAVTEKGLKPHTLAGGISTGINISTNANSAPGSGDITVLDTSIPLGAGARNTRDMQGFGALSVSHVYRLDLNPKTLTMRWKTDLLEYHTKQGKLSNLDLGMHTIRTGPEFTLLNSGVKFGVYGGYSFLELNHRDYLKTPKGEYVLDLPITPSVALKYSGSYEKRNYQNAPGITTYTDRDGQAWQQNFGINYIATDDWILNAGMFMRTENAQKKYFENNQYGANLGATYLISQEAFINANYGYRIFDYAANDPLISTKVRQDEEQSVGLLVGRSFSIPESEQRVTLTAGYTVRDVHSNIQNYDYIDNRISTSFSLAF
jgi:hypothetical protein